MLVDTFEHLLLQARPHTNTGTHSQGTDRQQHALVCRGRRWDKARSDPSSEGSARHRRSARSPRKEEHATRHSHEEEEEGEVKRKEAARRGRRGSGCYVLCVDARVWRGWEAVVDEMDV